MTGPLEAIHLDTLRAIAARPNGQANGILECIPVTGDYSIFDFIGALNELVASSHIDELREQGASAVRDARFTVTAKGHEALRPRSQCEIECEDLLARYGEAMRVARQPPKIHSSSAIGFREAKRVELESMHGRHWMGDGEQRFMLRWAVEAIEARNKRARDRNAGKGQQPDVRVRPDSSGSGDGGIVIPDGPNLEAKRKAEIDDQRRNVLYPVDAG